MEQLTVRYGQAKAVNPKDVGGPDSVWEFKKDGYTIWVSFFQGRCDRIAFGKNNNLHLTAEELKILLQASGRNKNWQGKPGDPKGLTEFRTEDGALEARVNALRTIVFIRTQEAFERMRQSQTAK